MKNQVEIQCSESPMVGRNFREISAFYKEMPPKDSESSEAVL